MKYRKFTHIISYSKGAQIYHLTNIDSVISSNTKLMKSQVVEPMILKYDEEWIAILCSMLPIPRSFTTSFGMLVPSAEDKSKSSEKLLEIGKCKTLLAISDYSIPKFESIKDDMIKSMNSHVEKLLTIKLDANKEEIVLDM